MRATRAFLGALGAGLSLAMAGSVALLVVSSVLAFRGWPDDLGGPGSPRGAELVAVHRAAAPQRLRLATRPAARASASLRSRRSRAANHAAPADRRSGASRRASPTAPRQPAGGSRRPSAPVPPGAPVTGAPAVLPPSVRQNVTGATHQVAGALQGTTQAAAGVVAPVSPVAAGALTQIGAAGAGSVEAAGATVGAVAGTLLPRH